MTPKYQIYTANQPLCLGGQIYMWNRYNACGALVHMPDAQFTKGGHQNRIELIAPDGKKQLVVFPIKDRYLKSINDCELHDVEKTFKKVLATFDALYSRYEHYKLRRDDLRDLFAILLGSFFRSVGNGMELRLSEFNLAMFQWVREHVGLNIQQHNTMDLFPNGRPDHPSEWVAEMGRAIGCTTYLGGETAQKAYIREEDFKSRGMTFIAQKYEMVPYKRKKDQYNMDAQVSILDPLFVGGRDLVLELINGPAYY